MDILTQVLAVFTTVGNWFITTLPLMLGLFYVEGSGLTFLGVLACAGLGVSVIFLLIGVIQNFLHFRG